MNDHLCSRCQTCESEFLCFCSEVRLCSDCLSHHLLESPSLTHKPVPLASHDLIQSFKLHLDTGKPPPLSKSDPTYDRRSLLEREIKRIARFQTDAMLQLQHLKVHYEAEIARTIDELVTSLHLRTLQLTQELQQALIDLNEKTPSPTPVLSGLIGDDFLILNLEVVPFDLSTALRQSLRLTTEFKTPSILLPTLYKFFGGSGAISIFTGEETPSEKFVVQGHKFLHSSSWCVLPSEEVLITGGSLTGHSQNSVLKFSGKERVVSEMEGMNVARRCHASVYWEGGGYVFGGVLEEEKMRVCERYDWKLGEWREIAQMHERRAYMGCCVYQDLLIICGGGETSSLEIYHPSLSHFSLIPISLIDLCDVTTLLSLDTSILVFHGNFTGEVSRLDPQTGQVCRESKFCYGNSWSCCAPVRCGDVVYCLRSESIFKYNLNTGESAYVVRLAKAVKKREYD